MTKSTLRAAKLPRPTVDPLPLWQALTSTPRPISVPAAPARAPTLADDLARAAGGRTSTPARPPAKLPRLLTILEVAAQCQVSTKTIRRWIERGELPVHHLGRQLRVAEDDLAVFLRRHRR